MFQVYGFESVRPIELFNPKPLTPESLNLSLLNPKPNSYRVLVLGLLAFKCFEGVSDRSRVSEDYGF